MTPRCSVAHQAAAALERLSCRLPVPSDENLRIEVLVRNACSRSGKNSGTARLWYNGQPIGSGPMRDAGSRLQATIGNGEPSQDYFLRPGFTLSTTAGTSRLFVNTRPAPSAVPSLPSEAGARPCHSWIRPEHLDRAAYVYVRQLSLYQAEHPASADSGSTTWSRGRRVGWATERMVVLDEDQGIEQSSAGRAVHRAPAGYDVGYISHLVITCGEVVAHAIDTAFVKFAELGSARNCFCGGGNRAHGSRAAACPLCRTSDRPASAPSDRTCTLGTEPPT